LPLSLPLADAEDVFKVVIGVVFAIIWIVAQVAASGSTAKKKRQQALLVESQRVQPTQATLAPVLPPPDSYNELRRRRQGVQNRPQPQPRQKQRQHKTQRPRPEPVASPSPAAAPRPTPVATGAIPDAISRTEISGDGLARSGAEMGPRIHKVRALLTPRSARDVIVAAELLGPPAGLRT
jgi:hypothetical protein